MTHFKCTVCGYTYRPERGDRIRDIEPGTKFDNLPEHWRCPTCNEPKMAFAQVQHS